MIKKRLAKVQLNADGLDENSVLVICAHSDDQTFGPGGTVAKYAKEGKKVFTVIFSYGEVGNLWYRKDVTIPWRVKEAQDVDKYMGGNGVVFLGLDETKFIDQFQKKNMYIKLKRLIEQHKPARIFTHSVDDPMPDHRAVNKCVIETIDKMHYKSEVYMFDVWTLFNFKGKDYVRIIVDISDTYDKKVAALRLFKSQRHVFFVLLWSVYLRAWICGRKIHARYGEAFYKIR